MEEKENGINVLFLEDEAAAYYYLAEYLEEEGFNIYIATNVSRARTLWENKRIDFIIADLNMPPRGLDDTGIAETYSGKLTGWVYLDKYVYSEKPEMKERTIILSAYLEELKEKISEMKLNGITLIAKKRDEVNDDKSDIKEVLKEMAKKLGSREDG